MTAEGAETAGEIKVEPGHDFIGMITKLVVGMLINYLGGYLKRRIDYRMTASRSRKKAVRIASRGRDVPEDIRDEALEGLKRRDRRKFEKGLRKTARKKRRKRARRILLALCLIGLMVAAALRIRRYRFE